MLTLILTYALIGALAGLLAGLLGIGGGLVIVPLLLLSFASQGLESSALMQVAIGTSLATIVLTSLSSIRAHHQRGAVRWPLVRQMAPSLLLGALLGATVASALSGAHLAGIFALFLAQAAFKLLRPSHPADQAIEPSAKLTRLLLALYGGLIGLCSALVGIGGGTLTVPLLTHYGVPIRQAIASSAACGLPIAVAGALGFLINGWQHPDALPHSAGFIYLPALAGISVFSLAMAPLGARLAHQWPVQRIRQLFGGFLLLLSLRFLHQALS